MSDQKITVALAGNANVGKSVIFNQLTGLHQHVGNWPGKTVERAEGTLNYAGTEIDILDLPGIYSLSTYSIEELVSREYIAVEQPDVLVNVVDASALERNLAFTIQLTELEPRMIIALNQIDAAEAKGILVFPDTLSELLGVPVIPTVAVKGAGLTDLMAKVVEVAEKGEQVKPLLFGAETEERIKEIADLLKVDTPYPKRWVALKLLEGDEEISNLVYGSQPELIENVEQAISRIEEVHGHDVHSVIASERYSKASTIANECTRIVVPETTLGDRLEAATTHPILGYVFMITSILAIFYGIFSFGDWLAGVLEVFFAVVQTVYYEALGVSGVTEFIWNALIDGLIGGIIVALPYIGPFYLVLSVLEDSGYLARIAFLMDTLMHAIGLHGKAFIPIMLGFGCNVPGVLGAKIMETERERLICAFVASLVPCAARSIVIMGLVAAYVGFRWALLLYVIDFILIFILGRIAYKVAPDEPVGLIMEMPGYRRPSVKTTAQRTWFNLRGFVYEAFPIMVAGNFVIQLASMVGLLSVVEWVMSPITVWWLGLPAAAGVVLIFGVLRKELTLILLGSLLGSTNFATILTPVQMFVFAFVVMVYVPCISTIAALVKEFGRKNAAIISGVEVLVAVFLGGVILRVLLALGLP
ncbi:MAG: ferrous iron transport protein B [Candidatus Bathyarchaeota archaeon]|nr:ferrous iron transport protein B [Candidatus Bathyarchaeota archaeon]